MTQRSIHIQQESHWEDDFLHEATGLKYVKVVDPGAGDPYPGKSVIIRRVDPDEQRLVAQGADGAHEWWTRSGNWVSERAWAWGLETGCNEPACGSPDACQSVVAYQLAWLEEAHRRNIPQKTVALNFSMGVPEPEYSALFAPVVDACDYVGFHEYWRCDGPHDPACSSWLTQRYRRVFEALGRTKPSFITESGIALGDPKGWRDADKSEDQYLKECLEYCDECGRDGYIEAVFFFTSGGGHKWSRFELTQSQVKGIVESNRA